MKQRDRRALGRQNGATAALIATGVILLTAAVLPTPSKVVAAKQRGKSSNNLAARASLDLSAQGSRIVDLKTVFNEPAVALAKSTEQGSGARTSPLRVPAPAALPSTADGFGANAVGGAGGPTVTVTNAAEYQQYVTASGPYIIQVSGTITGIQNTSAYNVAPYKTIVGIGTNPTIVGNIRLRYVGSDVTMPTHNIIVQNLTITSADPNAGSGGEDGITIKEGAHDIWVDHCTFKDCADGELDITGHGDYVTVSWCKFYYTFNHNHNFVNLVAGDDTDSGNYYLTFHHNWWSTLCVERMPSVRFGHAHIYNNYYNTPGNNYNIRVRIASQCLIQNNYFENSKDQYVKYITSPPDGVCSASGNVFVATTGTHDPCTDTVFTPPYSYTLDAGSDVKSIVMAGAGAGGGGPPPPLPADPSDLAATAVSSSQINLSWTDHADNEDGFSIERSTDNVTFTQTGTAGAATGTGSTVNFSSTGLAPSTTYYYRVLAYNTGGNSGYSNTANAMTLAGSGGGGGVPPNCTCNGTTLTCTGTLINSATGRWAFNNDTSGTDCGGSSQQNCGESGNANHYDVYRLTNNTGAAACYTLTLTATGCNSGKSLGSAVFLGSYTPGANVCTNNTFINSSGGGTTSGTKTYSFNVANGAIFTVAVASDNACTGTGTYTLKITPCPESPPVPLTAIGSRKTHGNNVGPIDLSLLSPPTPPGMGVEDRAGQPAAGSHTIVFTFGNALSGSPGVSGWPGATGEIGMPNEYIVTLTGVPNPQTLTLSLSNINDVQGNRTANLSVNAGFLIGDTTGDGSVNSADVSQTKSRSGQLVAPGNARSDVNLDGTLNSSDVSLVKSKSGSALPP